MPDLIILLLQLGFLVLVVWSIWQVAQDAELRGKPGWLIAGLALITWPIGVFLWLAARPGVKKKGPVRFPGSIDCPKRGLTIPAHAFRCPNCGLPSVDVSSEENEGTRAG